MVGKKSHIVFLLAFLFFIRLYGQKSETKLEGRVLSGSNDVGAVHVSNLTKNRGTITDENGFFEISVSITDTLVFSAVQFKKKALVITQEVLDSPLFLVAMEDMLTELNEVVVMPYNLSGELQRDMGVIAIDQVITASTEGLPNAYVKPTTQSQRLLYTARTWDFQIGFGFKVDTDPLINYFTGRTKRLKKRIAREAQSKWIEEVHGFYPDSIYVQELNVPKGKIGDFIYSCEKDSLFEITLRKGDRLKLWEVLKMKSIEYLKDNGISEN